MNRVSVLVLALGLAGCGGRMNGPATVASYEPILAPTPATAPADYRINPLDELRIDVFQEPELSLRDLPVDTNGMIQVPLAGPIHAAGQTSSELAADIGAHLTRYLKNPQVAVNITEFTSQKITIGGAVQKSGIYEAPGKTTLLQAVSVAGGVTEYAKQQEVLVFRERSGQRLVARYDIGAIQTGLAADPTLQSGDVVVVGFSEARKRFRDILGVVPLAIGLFVALNQTGIVK